LRRVRWERLALEDFEGTLAFLRTRSPAAAVALSDEAERLTQLLGTEALGRPGRMPGTFEILIRRYNQILCYTIRRTGPDEEAIVIRVIHGARNWTSDHWPD
jgi:plasmid stabilization system protein ParE